MRKRLVKIILVFLVTMGVFPIACAGNKSKDDLANLDLSGSKQGQTVAFADVDGDGLQDKLVGAPYVSLAKGTGAVLIYKGSASGFSDIPVSFLFGDDNTGFNIMNLGDVDGDGIADFGVGAIHGNGTDVSLCGSVTVYKGGSNGKIIRKLSGEGPMDRFGYSIAAGDVNGDGKRDIAVSAPFNTNDPGLYQSGAVYVFLGPDFERRISLYASSTNKGLGLAVAMGEITNDGFTDLLLSASGRTLVYFGSSSFAPSIDAPDITITSAATGFGKSLAVIGDVTGDGLGELAIGAPNAVIGNYRDTGSVYIISGSAKGKLEIDVSPVPTALIARLDGEALFNRFGFSIAALGDIDSDGKPDFAVGAPMADVSTLAGNNILCGKVYIFRGKDVSPSISISNATKFEGLVKNQLYGTSLACGADGLLLIGAPGSNANTGGADMVDAATGQPVPGGSSGGASGSGGSCH
ncbi:MAG: hypothetical protein TUN42_10115 [Dehalogenimonas sp.]